MKRFEKSCAILLMISVNYAHGIVQRVSVEMVQRAIAPMVAVAAPIVLTQLRHCGTNSRAQDLNEQLSGRAKELNKKFPRYFDLISSGKEQKIYDFYKRADKKHAALLAVREVSLFNSMGVDELKCFVQTYMTYKEQIDFVSENIAYLQECEAVDNYTKLDQSIVMALALYRKSKSLENFTAKKRELEQKAPLHDYVWKNKKIEDVFEIYIKKQREKAS